MKHRAARAEAGTSTAPTDQEIEARAAELADTPVAETRGLPLWERAWTLLLADLGTQNRLLAGPGTSDAFRYELEVIAQPRVWRAIGALLAGELHPADVVCRYDQTTSRERLLAESRAGERSPRRSRR